MAGPQEALGDPAGEESLASFLARVGLHPHLGVLEEEEFTPALLASMRPDLLTEALVELGLSEEETGRLARALHDDASGGSTVMPHPVDLATEQNDAADADAGRALPVEPTLVPSRSSAVAPSPASPLPGPPRALTVSEGRIRALFAEELAKNPNPNEAAAEALRKALDEASALMQSEGGGSVLTGGGISPTDPASVPGETSGNAEHGIVRAGAVPSPVGRLAAAAEAGRRLAAIAREEEERLVREEIAQADAAAARRKEAEIEARRERAQALANRIEPVSKAKPPPPPAESAAEAAESAARAAAKAAATAPRSTADRARGRSSATARSSGRSGPSGLGESGHGGAQSEDARRTERIRTLASARKARQEEKALLLAEVSADRAMRNVRRPFAMPPDAVGDISAAASGAEDGADAPAEGSTDDTAGGRVGCEAGWEPIQSLSPASDASARRARLSVRLPAGGLVQMAWQGGRPPVWAVLDWLARLCKMSTEELIESCALVDRSTVPPREASCLLIAPTHRVALPSDPHPSAAAAAASLRPPIPWPFLAREWAPDPCTLS